LKILIISDTHRDNRNFLEILDREQPVDMLIHCGDIEGSEYIYEESVDCPVHMVAGNNDFFSTLSMEKEFDIGDLRVLLTHGHKYRVYRTHQDLLDEASYRGFDVVMYGHTHCPSVECEDGIWLINPGSLSYPRQEGRLCTYIIMDYVRGQEPEFEIRYV